MTKVQSLKGRTLSVALCLIMFFCSFTSALGQNKVTGTVKDSNGEPLVGVTVMEAGTQNGTVTNMNGQYTLDVKPGAKLTISYIGYTAQTVAAKSGANITLAEDSKVLNEVVVVGYGTMRRKDLTSSITTVKAEDLNKGVFTDPAQMLQGKVPGLVVSSTADPNGSPSITLRGASTLRSGAMSPYYVIDGIPGVDISMVAPDDIESIDVLRDATATAIYGSKAANGVIIITTKKGGEERTNVTYNGYVAFDNILKTYDMCTAQELRDYASKNNVTLKDGGASTDWQDEVLRTGISHSHNVGINGGNGRTNYMVSANLIRREGVIKMTGMDRFNFRSLVSTKVLKDHLTLSMGFNSMYGKHFGVPTNDEGGSVLDAMNYYSPTNAITNADGTWTTGSGSKNYNPLALMNEDTSETIWKRNQFMGKTALEIIKGLIWNVNYSWSNYQSTYSAYDTRYSQLEGVGNKNGQATRNTYFGREQTFETYINYDFQLGKNKFGLMGGYSWEQKRNNDGFGLTVQGYYNDDLTWYNMSYAQQILGVQNSVQSGYVENIKNISFYGRLNYSFDSRYMLQATIRRDGSSVFGENHRWGTFPSVSAAWNITEEEFMKNQNIFSNLKLRAGYGISGNAMGFDAYTSYATYGATGTFTYNDKIYRTYGPTKNANPDLKWESTAMLNIGLDYAFMNGRINGTIEVYNKKTKDLIWDYQVSTAQSDYIYSTIGANVGEMTNRGIEFTINAVPVQTKNFTWNTTLNLSHNKNTIDKVTNDKFNNTTLTQGDPKVSGVSADGWTQRIMEGQPLGTFYTYQYAGTVNGHSEYYVLDDNGNRTGETTQSPTRKDRSVTGCAQPKLNAGWNNTLSYKNWSLNMFITGVFGNDVYNSGRAHYTSAQMFSDGKNVLKEFLTNPAGDATGSLPSDRYIEKGSYVRLQTLSLSYTFRNCFNDWIKDLTIYGTANNLLTFTGYKGLDPEVNLGGIDPGVDYRWSRYPHSRTFMVGVKINFGGGKAKKAAPVYVDREVIKEIPVEKEVIKEVVKEVPVKSDANTYVVTFAQSSSTIANTAELDGIKSGDNVEVVAYASPEGNANANQVLSQKRADAVAKYLEDKGVHVTRVVAKGADSDHANRIAVVTVK